MIAVALLLGFALGLFSGFVLSILVAVLLPRYQAPVERTIKQVQAKVKRKGKLIEPEDETLKDWVKTLPNEHSAA